MDSWRPPRRVFVEHSSDEFSNLGIDTRPANGLGDVWPVDAKSFAVPRNVRCRA